MMILYGRLEVAQLAQSGPDIQAGAKLDKLAFYSSRRPGVLESCEVCGRPPRAVPHYGRKSGGRPRGAKLTRFICQEGGVPQLFSAYRSYTVHAPISI